MSDELNAELKGLLDDFADETNYGEWYAECALTLAQFCLEHRAALRILAPGEHVHGPSYLLSSEYNADAPRPDGDCD